MYGSDCLTKYTGLKNEVPPRACTKASSEERSPKSSGRVTSTRDSLSCSRPLASSTVAVVIAGSDFQQLDELEPVGLRQSGSHNVRRLRGRPQRLLDVLHELLDLEGGSLRHLPLQRPDALDALAVAEKEFDRTAGE